MNREEFAARIQLFRARMGYTQIEAARALGVSLRTLQNWEIARNMPRSYGLNALLARFGEAAPPGTIAPPLRRRRGRPKRTIPVRDPQADPPAESFRLPDHLL